MSAIPATATSSSTGNDRPLTVEETADELRVSRAHAYNLVNSGTIKAVRLGRSIRVPLAEVRRLQAGA
jgi:excisionase family DNA binding protein